MTMFPDGPMTIDELLLRIDHEPPPPPPRRLRKRSRTGRTPVNRPPYSGLPTRQHDTVDAWAVLGVLIAVTSFVAGVVGFLLGRWRR